MSDRQHHRPTLPGKLRFEAMEGGPDPAAVRDAAEQSAVALVRGTSGDSDDEVVRRVVSLADAEGLDALAELWSGAPPDSVAGSLWRLYLLRTWVHHDPARAALEFGAGRQATPVAEVLAGVVRGDYAVVLFRAAAFARVTAAGRTGETYDGDLSASRLLTLADQLEQAGRLELDQRL